ncbi:MAG: gamma-glutamylcyclotransferase [Candidatus Nanopelagicales bacterium]
MVLYAAYGPNLHPARMAERAPLSPRVDTGWLTDWRLTFAGEDIGLGGSLATVVEEAGSAVFVAIYELHPLDERRLDDWEGLDLGNWRKLRARVNLLTTDTIAWMYVLDAYEGGLPSAHYLGMLADSAEAGGAPGDYVTQIRQHPCTGIGPR